jgi:hypothetical protein
MMKPMESKISNAELQESQVLLHYAQELRHVVKLPVLCLQRYIVIPNTVS